MYISQYFVDNILDGIRDKNNYYYSFIWNSNIILVPYNYNNRKIYINYIVKEQPDFYDTSL